MISPMQIDLQTQGRDELIQAGTNLGKVLRESGRPGWIMGLDGDKDSGKSLIALAIDQVFSPEKYPHGITKEHKADDLCHPATVIGSALKRFFPFARGEEKPDLPVVFFNYCRITAESQKTYDRRLQERRRSNPQSNVLIVANLFLKHRESFNNSASGVNSDFLNLNVRVFGKPERFTQTIEIVTQDSYLSKALSPSLK